MTEEEFTKLKRELFDKLFLKRLEKDVEALKALNVLNSNVDMDTDKSDVDCEK